MNKTQSSAQLKSLAKGQLLGKYDTTVTATLIVGTIFLAITFIAQFTIDTSFIGFIFNILINVLIQLLFGLFQTGTASLYLNIACGHTYSVGDVFSGFKFHPDKAIQIKFFLVLIAEICLLPAQICFYIYHYSNSVPVFAISMAVLILGMITATVLMLSYSQVFYLLLDFPDYSAWSILKISKKIMRGHKGRLFYIQVSFLPWYLLTFFSCGIGLLWIVPYVKATNANFYLDLIQCIQKDTEFETENME